MNISPSTTYIFQVTPRELKHIRQALLNAANTQSRELLAKIDSQLENILKQVEENISTLKNLIKKEQEAK